MLLSDIEKLGFKAQAPYLDAKISSISNSTHALLPKGLFVATRGHKVDAHNLLSQIVDRASAIVVEDISKVPKQFKGVVFLSEDTRVALGLISQMFYNNPSNSLFCIGVTGTNGKTTVTYLLEYLLNFIGIPTGVIGTIDHHFEGFKWATQLTTADSIELQRRLVEFNRLGAQAVAMEVSSHALDQKRVCGLDFDIGIFTNLTRDHLDYHENFENYFDAKKILFLDLIKNSPKKTMSVINTDSEYGKVLFDAIDTPKLSYGLNDRAQLRAEITDENFYGTTFNLSYLNQKLECHLPLPCRYNVLNLLAAVGSCLQVNSNLNSILKNLDGFKGVPGRLERVENKLDVHIFVDYAHTDDALKNVLNSLRQIREKNKLKGKIITVFGCGGDRDKGKRPLMAQAVEKFSHHTILTSDNPRTEDPLKIIDDIKLGFSSNFVSKNVLIEPDRRKAIGLAIDQSTSGDVILIAGKGHEDYQIVGTEKHHFSDIEVVKEFL